MTFHEFEQFIQEYNKKHTKFYIGDEEYRRNFTRPVLNNRDICIGHLKHAFYDKLLIFRSYSSTPKIKKEMFNFLEDFNFKKLFFIPCNSHLYVYVAKIESLK